MEFVFISFIAFHSFRFILNVYAHRYAGKEEKWRILGKKRVKAGEKLSNFSQKATDENYSLSN